MKDELSKYLEDLDMETMLRMNEYRVRELAFTSYILEQIAPLMSLDEYEITHGRLESKTGAVQGAIHGYALSQNGELLTLFYTIYTDTTDGEVKSIRDSEFQLALNRMQGFYKYAIRGIAYDLSYDHPLRDAAECIYDNVRSINSVRLCVISNSIIRNTEIKSNRIDGKTAYTDVWDITKIHDNFTSGTDHIAINIDFEDEFSKFKIPFIEMQADKSDYKCYTTMFPAKLLYALYEKHSTELLQNNVRYFLGFKGSKKNNANIGIKETLTNENHMFLAYNNGITAIAAGVDTIYNGDKTEIDGEESGTVNDYISTGFFKAIKDFRIVNGGQTTASIFRAKNDDRKCVSLKGVYVAVKLIVLPENENSQDVASNITRFSNSQSKIKYSDFSVSNPFNMKMEDLSRSVLAPTIDHSSKFWFFERLRGQYDFQLKQLGKNDQALFKKRNPKECCFKKEELAKVWKSWNQEPFDAVKGEGTNYDMFITKVVKDGLIPDETYFKKSVALLIIYKHLLSRQENKMYGNKKASIICYAMAFLNHYTFNRLDLMTIWEQQSVGMELAAYLNRLCDSICAALTERAEMAGTTVLSYGKRKDTYENLLHSGELYANTDLIKNLIKY